MAHLSPSFSATLRVRLEDKPGSFARLAGAIGETGGLLGAIDLVRVDRAQVRDVTVSATNETHLHAIAEAVRWTASRSCTSDRTFPCTWEARSRSRSMALKTRDDLSMAYTPGVARILGGGRRRPGGGLEPDDQAEHRRGRVRRHR